MKIAISGPIVSLFLAFLMILLSNILLGSNLILSNLFKKKKKWIRFYSLTPGVKDLHPWIPASKFKRQWKTDALKKYYGKDSTCPVMKVKRLWDSKQRSLNGQPEEDGIAGLFQHAVTCPALTTLFNTGWIMTAPGDFLIKTDGEDERYGKRHGI